MSFTNFFIVPSGLNVTQFSCRSGNVYIPVNNIITNVATQDTVDLIAAGARQVAGPDSGTNLPWVASRFYNPVPGSTPGTLLTVASTIYAFPFRSPGNIPVQTLNVDVTTAQLGGSMHFGLYTDVSGAPSALLADSGIQVATATGGVTYTPASPITLNEGWYWAALIATATNTFPTVASIAAGYGQNLNAMTGQDTLAHAIATSGEAANGVTASMVYGALPATFPTASYALNLNAAVPLIVIGT